MFLCDIIDGMKQVLPNGGGLVNKFVCVFILQQTNIRQVIDLKKNTISVLEPEYIKRLTVHQNSILNIYHTGFSRE